MKEIYINGKFLGQATTGAQRFSMEIVLAIDELLSERAESLSSNFTLVIPNNVNNLPALRQIHIKKLAGFSSHLWEQISLLVFVENALLINLSGSAPLLKRNQIITIFDAAIYDFSSAYNPIFLFWYQMLHWIQLRFCLRLLTISNFSLGRLCEHLKVNNKHFTIIPCGVDHIYRIALDESILNKHELTPNGYLLAVGSANPSKNFSALIMAFAVLDKIYPVRLVVVGGVNPTVFAGHELIDDERIVKTGRVSDEQLKALYTNAIAFIFPSLYEGFGIPPLEALACGCPVIASNLTSIPEVCSDAVGYFDPTSIISIKNALERIITDDDWRSTLREAGKDRAKEFTWRNAAEKLLNYLDSLV
jgi:glycosyltransferase involved in cell wall biosynthesis